MQKEFQVIKINDKEKLMTLNIDRSFGCSKCSAKSGCGIGIINNLRRYSTFTKPLQENISVGDFVNLEISSIKLFKYAFLFYILPILALFFTSYIVKNIFFLSEIWQILFGFISFFVIFLLNKYLIK
jgi:positive regulator of sigma E activity